MNIPTICFQYYCQKKTSRIKFVKYLKKKGIFVSMHYPPIHKFKFYKNENELKKTTDISKRLVSLPMYPDLNKKEILKITNEIKKFLDNEI